MKNLVKFIVTFGGVGYAPFWPGAFGSLAGILLAWFFYPALLWMCLFFAILGLIVSRPAASIFQNHDPQVFVLDEVAGMMLTLLTLPKELNVFIAGYVLFRIFDVWKPWLIRRLERLPNPMSIMWDDLAAGFVSNIILQVVFRIVLV